MQEDDIKSIADAMKTYIGIVLTTLACLQSASASNYEPHIAGGEEAVPHSHPHHVALQDELKVFRCGGSIISDIWVITAAHCVEDNSRPIRSVYCGAHNRKRQEDTTVKVRVQLIQIHKYYNPNPRRNDIALLKLEESLTPYIKDGKHIKPIRLPKMSDNSKTYWRSKVTVTGWGRMEHIASQRSSVLNSLNTTVLWNPYCTVSLFPQFNLEEQICTSGNGNIGPCYGDGGGPLTEVESDGERTLIGITSYLSDDYYCTMGGPAGFTRVASFLEWIKAVTAHQVHIRP